MPVTNAGTLIDARMGKDYIKNYLSASAYFHQSGEYAFAFSSSRLQEMQNVSGVLGLRFYLALEPKKVKGETVFKPQMVVVGVDKDDNDVFKLDVINSKMALNSSLPCPSFCPNPGHGILDL